MSGFQNCEIVSVGRTPVGYHDQKAKRGSPEFVLSSSPLREHGHCAERWFNGYSGPETKAKNYGSVLDCRTLTPEEFAARFAVQPVDYETTAMECPSCGSVTDSKKCAKCKCDRIEKTVTKPWTNQSATCAAWVEKQESEGRLVVSQEDMLATDAAIASLRADETIAAFLDESDRQVHIVGEWHDMATSLVIKIQSLLDIVPREDSQFKECAADLKSARSAFGPTWEREVFQRGYFIQAAFHLDMLNAATGGSRNTFCHIVSENYAPFQSAKRMLSEDFLTAGRNEYTRLIENYAQCVAHNFWPDYDYRPAKSRDSVQGWLIVNPPGWLAMAQADAAQFDFTEPEAEEDAPPGLDIYAAMEAVRNPAPDGQPKDITP